MQSFREILSSFLFLFVFKKPRFAELGYIDLVIDDKPLLFIFWKLKYGNKLRLKQLKKTIRKKEGSLILKLPESIQAVDILISNTWRTNRKKIKINHTNLDKETAGLIIQQFQPLSNVKVKNTSVTVKRTKVSTPAKTIFLKPLRTSIKKQFRVKAGKFDYPLNKKL